MSQLFFILMLIAMVLTAISLFIGIGVSVKGGKTNQKYGNKLMRMRVVLQGVALLFFALAIMTSQS